MKNNKILKFPKITFILTCRHCESTNWVVHLNSSDPKDIAGFECIECEKQWIYETNPGKETTDDADV